jgi:hypothetical protein
MRTLRKARLVVAGIWLDSLNASSIARYPFSSPIHAREGADGQAVVCPLLRGQLRHDPIAPAG